MHIDDTKLKSLSLLDIEFILSRHSRSLKEFPPMELPSFEVANFSLSRLIIEDLDYDCRIEIKLFDELYNGMKITRKLYFIR